MPDEQPPCTCGNNNICIRCVLRQLEEEEEQALEELVRRAR